MATGTLTTFDFHGATLMAQLGDRPDTTLVAMKPVVEGMGLDWSAQFKKIKQHPVLSTSIAVIAIEVDSGAHEACALPLSKLNFWLATIHPDRIKNKEVRERIIRYQIECADALFAHFFGKAFAKPAPAGETPSVEPTPWARRSNEDRQVELKTIAAYGRYCSHAAAWWYAQEHALLPEPPNTMLPTWRQAELALREPARVMTFSVREEIH